MPSGGLGEIAVLCVECRLVPEGQFGLVGYADPCVRYDLLRTMGHRKSERIFPIINHKLQHIAQKLQG